METMNYVSLCSGYGSELLALKRLRETCGLRFRCLAWSEIDSGAVRAHDRAHPECRGGNLGDLTKVDWKKWHESIGSPHVHLLFASTPCQTVSTAGKNAGMKKDSDAASALIWATEDCIRALRPDILMYENVKGMVNKRHRKDFDAWCDTLRALGYSVQWAVLNAKNFGVAQNRERIFPIAVRDGIGQTFVYPHGWKCDKAVEDYLEDEEEITDDYYVDEEIITGGVLRDLLKQPQVREEMTALYHEEWREALGDEDG